MFHKKLRFLRRYEPDQVQWVGGKAPLSLLKITGTPTDNVAP